MGSLIEIRIKKIVSERENGANQNTYRKLRTCFDGRQRFESQLKPQKIDHRNMERTLIEQFAFLA